MRRDVDEVVGVVLDSEIETPTQGDARLPKVATHVVLLGAQRGVADILEEEFCLAIEGFLDR
jgi:hypothetical protein